MYHALSARDNLLNARFSVCKSAKAKSIAFGRRRSASAACHKRVSCFAFWIVFQPEFFTVSSPIFRLTYYKPFSTYSNYWVSISPFVVRGASWSLVSPICRADLQASIAGARVASWTRCAGTIMLPFESKCRDLSDKKNQEDSNTVILHILNI